MCAIEGNCANFRATLVAISGHLPLGDIPPGKLAQSSDKSNRMIDILAQ
jgi:hypothetical protein